MAMPRGRPTKFSIELQEAICNSVRNASTFQAAAEANGLKYDTFNDWMADNHSFSQAVYKAKAECSQRMAAVLQRAALGTKETPGDWRAALEYLKRRDRLEWSDNITLTTDNTVAGLLASLFPEDAGESDSPSSTGVGEAD
jgi:hypothetical protein